MLFRSLGPVDMRPEQYLPSFSVELLDGLVERLTSHLAESEVLLDEPFFEGWIYADQIVYELAESAGPGPLHKRTPDEQEPFLERFCTELIEPQKLGLLRRLLLSADLMQQSGAAHDLVQRVLAVSLSLVGAPIPLVRHPFVRRLALDSIEMARQSLDEGFDPRKQAPYDDDEWE